MRKQIRIGLVGLGLMGKELASAAARYGHLLTKGPVPVITAICNQGNQKDLEWFNANVPSIRLATTDYRELVASSEVDAVYCAVPHHLHEEIYVAVIEAGKHLLGEKPFGIDREANRRIVESAASHPELVVRCSSQFPFYPGAKRVVEWIRSRTYGRLIEARAGFLHSSDLDLSKPINWKRMTAYNGRYGCMGDLGFHTHHIPLRVGWRPRTVFAELQNIVPTRPDGKGGQATCDTWDNATLLCRWHDPGTGEEFPLSFETKRMAPGNTNTWYIEVYGTAGSCRFSTREPRTVYTLESRGREQGWTRTDIGADLYIPSITGGIFETGFSDAILQMLGAFLGELDENGSPSPFQCGKPEETAWSHGIMTAALASHDARSAAKVGDD